MGKKMAVFGGSFIQRILENCQLEVSDKCLWIDPVTLCNRKDIEEINAIEKLENFLENCTAKILLLELSSLRMSLYETLNRDIYRYEDIKRYEKERNVVIMGKRKTVLEMEDSQIENNLLALCERIKKKFDKVILVSATPLGIVDNEGYYILAGDYWKRMAALLRKCEKIVYENLRCNYLDVTQYYIPRSSSDSYVFEPFFWEEIEEQIKIMEHKEREHNNQINDKHKYYTASKGFRSLYKKSVFKILLDLENPVEQCISYTSFEFIHTYIHEIIELNYKGYKTLNELKIALKQTKSIPYVIIRFIASILLNEDINEREDELFKEQLAINDVVIDQLKEDLKVYGNFNLKVITNRNISYYYNVNKMLKKESINGDDISKLLLNDAGNPILIDIWGSCLSRFIFNYADEGRDKARYVVNNYIFHANPLNINKKERILVEGLRDGIHDERSLKLQLEGKIRSYYEKSESEWIIVDLYALFSSSVFNVDNTYICTREHIGERYFPGRRCLPIFKEIPYEEIIRKMKEFTSFLISKYKKKIILISAHNSMYYAKQGKIYSFDDLDKIKDINIFLEKIERLVAELADCYYIDISRYFISDDKQISNIAPFHYEKELYWEEYKIIKSILEGCHNIEEKHINSIDNDLLLERFIKYKDKNKNVILEIFPYYKNLIYKELLHKDIVWLERNFSELNQLITYFSLCKNAEDIRCLCMNERTREVLEELLKNLRSA